MTLHSNGHMMSGTLYDLPDDVLIYNITFLSVPDIIHFRQLADSPLTPKREINFLTGSSTLEIKFIPGRQNRWLLTISAGTTSVLTIWDITRQQTCSEWFRDGAAINAFELNTDPESEASMAVFLGRLQRLVLLRLDNDGNLYEIHSINTDLHPVNLTGDLMALSDDRSKTVINNWKTGAHANLDDLSNSRPNCCFQVVFAPCTILVVRMFSVHLYAIPPLLGETHTPIATHSFGWVNNVSVPSSTPNNAFSILTRFRASGTKFVELYTIPSTLSTSPPYTFPLTLITKISSHTHSSLYYCADLVLGKCATAIWARPRDDDDNRSVLMTAVFPGPLNPTDQVRVHEVPNTFDNWASLDYDEERGRIALGSVYGKIRILYL
ncbi:uncharacterized protein ARMOST_14193 [Armillaria ostoyae]|uniref:Uncharacterized protein n=1 Tax=Armillaria ostoyae TaxID=47428 RepID=A0A284RPX0_ARMOS|nr:uncharacterized protein ARMOST_14193 [Armillaria ostoyae]